MQPQQFNNHRHVCTGTHCRTHGVVKGTFAVLDGLPDTSDKAIASPKEKYSSLSHAVTVPSLAIQA
jgi:hypothetical protein